MALPLAAIAGFAQAGLGIAQAFSGPPPDTSGVRQAALQNAAIRAQNERTKQIWQTRLDQTKQQYGRNRDSADRAYTSLQLKENEQLEAYLSQRAGMMKQLIELKGRYGAREVYGKSAARLASQPEKEYGVAVRTLHDNMVRFSEQVDRDLAEVARQHLNADENAYAGISVPPALLSEVPIPEIQAPSGLNTGLKIGSAILGGLSTFASLKAPAATNAGAGGGGMNYSGGAMSNAFEGATGLGSSSFGGFSGGGFGSSSMSFDFNPLKVQK